MFRTVRDRAAALLVGMFGSSIFTMAVMTGAVGRGMDPISVAEFAVGCACMIRCAWVVLDDRYEEE